MKKVVYVFVLLIYSLSTNTSKEFRTLAHIKSKAIPTSQETAVRDLFKRILPNHFHLFSITVDPTLNSLDEFRVEKTENGNVNVLGTSGVAVASGLNYYLKYYCKCQITWQDRQLNLPEILPKVNVTVTFNDKYRYYQNVCTTSYSFVWWDWKQWEKHIDWMALNGFNLVLAFSGQEEIWKRIYTYFGMTQDEIDQHFTGPAFLSWNRMGNLRRWGGPLSNSWHERSLYLQKKIVDRMRSLGIITVLPGFAGHVPRAFKRLFPNASMTEMGQWSKFNELYCCPYLLNPTDPLFTHVGEKFYKELIREFGTDHVYNCDTFNEMDPPEDDLDYLHDVGEAVYLTILTVDSQAIWVMQGWMFYDDPFWTESRAKALITSVPQGKMIILDLQSEQFPQYNRLNSYFGQPYIWCMLHNFGGTLGMFGSAEIINTEPFKARAEKNSTMMGIGLTPEGINQNYVIYDLMSEMAWRKDPTDLVAWFGNYSRRRYGEDNTSTNETWQILKDSIYNFSGTNRIRGKYSLNVRPTLHENVWRWYNASDLFQGFVNFLDASEPLGNVETYKYDAVDLTRQVLQVLGDIFYQRMVRYYNHKNLVDFRWTAQAILELLDDMDLILASNENFLLGRWLEDAKAAASTEEEKDQFEYNARNQITLWGPNGEIRDYANKQWAGVVSDYFKPRWQLYLGALNETLTNGVPFNETEVNERIFMEVEQAFTFSKKNYSTKAEGNSVDIARYVRDKWTIKMNSKQANEGKSLWTDLETENVKVFLVPRSRAKRKFFSSTPASTTTVQ